MEADDRVTTEQAYQILGLDSQADAAAVKRAYRRRALEWHPDRWAAAADKDFYAGKFRSAREAYEWLRSTGYPELQAEPVPEPDFTPRVGGRSFSPKELEDAPQADKLGLKLEWSLDSVLVWAVVMPAGAVVITLVLKWLFVHVTSKGVP